MENIKNKKADKQLREIAYGKKLALAQMKNDYITNLINGRYFLARYNMMIEQLQNKEIKESVDGCVKTEEYMFAEAVVLKRQALSAHRAAHFGKLDLTKEFGLTEEDIKLIENDYYDGKIIREDYDEGYKKGNKAEFVGK